MNERGRKKLATSSQLLLENICIYSGSWGPADRQASHSNTASSWDCETLKINRHNLLLLQTDSLSLSGLGESIKIFPPGQPRLLRLMLIYWLWWLIHLISYQTSDRPNWDTVNTPTSVLSVNRFPGAGLTASLSAHYKLEIFPSQGLRSHNYTFYVLLGGNFSFVNSISTI